MLAVVTIETPALGDRSYLVHDGEVGLVVDPQRDIDRVLTAVEGAGVRITQVAEAMTERLTRAQFRSVRRLAAQMPDDAAVLPTHGFGSFCSSSRSSGGDA